MPIRQFLPLTPLSLGILIALADEDRHGYAILKQIQENDPAGGRPGTGTLYAALQRMTDEGLIQSSTLAPAAGEDARRRYYAITALGRDVARAELQRLANLVAVGTDKHLLRPASLRSAARAER